MPSHLPFSHKFLWLCESHMVAVCWHHVPWVPSILNESTVAGLLRHSLGNGSAGLCAFTISPQPHRADSVADSLLWIPGDTSMLHKKLQIHSVEFWNFNNADAINAINAIPAMFPGYLEQCLSQCKAADPWHQIMDCPFCSSTGRYSSVCRAEDFQHGLGVLHYWGPSGQGTSEYTI